MFVALLALLAPTTSTQVDDVAGTWAGRIDYPQWIVQSTADMLEPAGMASLPDIRIVLRITRQSYEGRLFCIETLQNADGESFHEMFGKIGGFLPNIHSVDVGTPMRVYDTRTTTSPLNSHIPVGVELKKQNATEFWFYSKMTRGRISTLRLRFERLADNQMCMHVFLPEPGQSLLFSFYLDRIE